ncbi:hypothetical protein VU01_12234 [Candidatus Electrothrix marina]|uniref:DUF4276 family protein n=1 Tax=Candidatus Electrothrix marina TaxID=1859130 RepID=A0A444JD98_9BACT|nr:hypothetical protein VU01_12234 [Candidatus Electrothrix marina]
MTTLVFFLEEPSAKEMLLGILPKILPEHVVPRFIVFEGKQDLEKQLVRKLKLWQLPDSRFIVLRDQDAGDCRKIKENLQKKCKEAGRPDTIVRIACHELESFYLGDLQAVEKGLPMSGLAKRQNQRKFRQPDNLPNPARELTMLTKKNYQKIDGSRAIGRYLNPEDNRSNSFNILIKAVKDIISHGNSAQPN